MKEIIKELIEYRALLLALTARNIKIKYKQTIMGFLWALFMPAIIVLSGIIVKKAMTAFSGNPLQISELATVAVKSLPWAFFVGALKFSVNSLVGNMNLVTKIYFPREIFPISYVLAQLFDFLVAGSVLVIILMIMGLKASVYLLYLPLLLFILFILTLGLSLIFSCGNLFFRDVKYIVDVVLTFAIFFTPVFYEAEMFGKWKAVLLLNPVGSILESINRVVIMHKMPESGWFAYAILSSVFIFIFGILIFHKNEPLFAENI